MKYLFLAFLATALITSSCSSEKHINYSHYQNDQSGQNEVPATVRSYGPKGRIIESQPQNDLTALQPATRYNAAKKATSIHQSTVTPHALLKERGSKSSAKKFGKNVKSNYAYLMEVRKSKSILYKANTNSDSKIYRGGNPKTNGLAIAGFVSSLVGIFVFGIILGIVAIVFGGIALKSQRRGLAIASLTIGIVDIVGVILVIGMM